MIRYCPTGRRTNPAAAAGGPNGDIVATGTSTGAAPFGSGHPKPKADRTVRIGIEGVARIGPHRELCRTGPEASFHPSDRRAS